jgi:N-acetyl-gamma-glutamyl-phosphate reductase
MPELAARQRERAARSKRIANPGCHASAFIVLLRPLVDAGLVPADLPVTRDSRSPATRAAAAR